jgi:hypothetical protein
MSHKFAGYIIFIAVLTSVVVSCTPGSCTEETVSKVKAGFYQTGTGKPLKADSVTLYGLGKESDKIYNKALNLQTIYFPLDASKDKSTLILRINGKNDTITLEYTSYPHLVSKECGYTFYHILDTVYNTRNDLDFLKKSQNVTTFYEENIRIYY